MTDYTRLRQLAENATPGPWVLDSKERTVRATSADIQPIMWDDSCFDADNDLANGQFIAAANPDTILNLLEDLRLTRQERDDAKHDCLEVRKANARLGEACIKAEAEVAALRRGQGSAPEPAGPSPKPTSPTL